MSEQLAKCVEELERSPVFNHLYPVCIEEKCKRALSKGEIEASPDVCERCPLAAEEYLKLSSMFVRVRSVAFAVGFCPYAARLVELFGVQRVPLTTIPGKGSLVHRLLALAAPQAFETIIQQVLNERHVDAALISSVAADRVNNAAENLNIDSESIEVLEGLSQQCSSIIVKLVSEGPDALSPVDKEILLDVCCREIAEALGETRVPSSIEGCAELAEKAQEAIEKGEVVKQSIETATRILENALRYASHFVLAAGWDTILPLVEYTLHDFEYRLVGVPDFILLEPVKRQAIIFEWKSSPKETKVQVQEWERVQTLLYALLTANLLGYETGNAERVARLMGDGILTPVLCHHRRCVNLVKSSDALRAPQIALHRAGFVHSRLKQYQPQQVRDILLLARLAAEHLVLLAVAPYRENDECRVRFKSGSGESYYGVLYRLIPDELRDNSLRKSAGLSSAPWRPANEQNRLCIKYCKDVLGLFHACKFYMRELHELRKRNDELGKKIRSAWSRVSSSINYLIKKHTEVYTPFRALYYLRSKTLMEYLRRSAGRSPLHIKYEPYRTTTININTRNPNVIEVSLGDRAVTYRFQVFRKMLIGGIVSSEYPRIVRLENAYLPTMIVEEGEGTQKIKLAMPRRDRSIQILFISPLHVRYNAPVATGLSVFLRSTEVDYGVDGDPHKARMELVVPSRSLLFSLKVFKENLERLASIMEGVNIEKRADNILSFECKGNCVFLAFESDVDLTYIARSVLDKLIRIYVALTERENEDEISELGDSLGLLLGELLAT